jgi:hypothetical protein
VADHLREYQFEKGQEKTPGSGRKIGVRNKLSEKFLKDLHSEWERSGEAALKILAKEDPATFAKLALGVLPKELDHDGFPPSVIVVNTGVDRGPSALPAPPAALPAPKKEVKAEAQPLVTADLVAPLPRAADLTRPAPEPVRKTEPLIYPKVVPRIGWR